MQIDSRWRLIALWVLAAALTAVSPVLGFFNKDADGRIDDASAGGKGEGLWTTFGMRAMFHGEGGKTSRPRVFRFADAAPPAGALSWDTRFDPRRDRPRDC